LKGHRFPFPLPAAGEATGLGLISGTSMDGIDAAAASFRWSADGTSVTAATYLEVPWKKEVVAELKALAAGVSCTAADIARLHHEVGREFGRAASAVLDAWSGPAPDFAASHGQTVAHLGPRGTLQLGCGAAIAAATGLPVVADLRVADLALGGEGAPILPAADIALRRHPDLPRVILNLGGIANATLLPPISAGDPAQLVKAFDIGPANAILDSLAAAGGGESGCDLDGALAAAGTVDVAARDELIDTLAAFTVSGRSLHRDDFTGSMLDEWLASTASGSSRADLLATATAATAVHIARGLRAAVDNWLAGLPLAAAQSGRIEGVYVAGGGAHNPMLCKTLADELAKGGGPMAAAPPRSLNDLSADPPSVVTIDNREAVDISLLGLMFLRETPTGLPVVTGASTPAMLGALHLPPSGFRTD